MTSYFFEETNVNMPLGIWSVVFLLLISVVIRSFITLSPQSGYGQSKWDKKQKNEKISRSRKERALSDKLKRQAENKAKRKLHASQRPLKSQSSKQDFVNLGVDFSEYVLDTFGHHWLALRELAANYNFNLFSLPSFPSMETFSDLFEKNYSVIKESDIWNDFYEILTLLITLGWIKKIDLVIKGTSVFATEPLRRKVSFFELLEKVAAFSKKFVGLCISYFQTGDILSFFKSERYSAYDDEYTTLMQQKLHLEIGRGADITGETFDRRVSELITKTTILLDNCKTSERSYYSARLNNLKQVVAARSLAKKDGIRKKPYGILLFGGSGVGKSAISNALVRYVLKVNDKDSSPRAIITLNQDDKFQSEFQTHHSGVILDDICNTSLDFTDGSPTTSIIMFLNNIPMAALNPNAEMKGKIMIEPDVVVGTTNVKDLLSNALSNEPLSINRRFEVTITQKVKPEFCKKGTKMLDNSKIAHMANHQFPDYATFTVEYPRYMEDKTGDKFKSGRTQTVVYEPMIYKGKKLIDIQIGELLAFLKADSRAHFKRQEAFVAGQRTLEEMPLCKCDMPAQHCVCCPLENQAGLPQRLGRQPLIPYYNEVVNYFYIMEGDFCEWLTALLVSLFNSKYGCYIIAFLNRGLLKFIVVNSLLYVFIAITMTLLSDVLGENCGIMKLVVIISLYLLYIIGHFWFVYKQSVEKWSTSLLLSLFNPKYGYYIAAFLNRGLLTSIVMNSLFHVSIAIATSLLSDIFGEKYGIMKIVVIILLYLIYVIIRFWFVYKQSVEKWTTVTRPSTYLRSMSWKTKQRILAFICAAGVWKVVVELVRNYNTLKTKQAAVCITLKPDMKPYQKTTEFWDVHSREKAYQFGNAGASNKSKTTSYEQLCEMVGSRQLYIQREDGQACNAIPLRSNVLIIPNHFVTRETTFVTLIKVGGHTFRNIPLASSVCKRVAGTDFAFWYAPGAGEHRDLIEYFPKDIDIDKKVSVKTVYNDNGKSVLYGEMTAIRGRVIASAGTFSGYNYHFPVETFGGLCMATLIGNAKGIPFIAGAHLAGRGYKGAAGFVTRTQLYETLEQLEAMPGVLLSSNATPMETQSMGVNFGPLERPHFKCPTHNLESDAKIRIHGGHTLSRSSPKSAVVESVISAAVAEVMDIPKQHGPPPEMNAPRHKEVDIAGKVDTACKFDADLMAKAYVDYSIQLDKLPKKELAKLGKISDDVNLAGLDGVLGINAINFATSVGWPSKGPKTQFVEKSDRFVEGISCPRDVDPSILEEVARYEEMLLNGESINAVFKASLKDEPTKNGKDKVRVFAAANFPFVFLVRKYFLSVAALMQRNKQVTECAVGTVVQSPEWTELFEHIGKFGWDRAIAGDYAKFDARMSVHFMLMAFKLLIKVAETSGNYDEDDLKIMRGIASEISYPTYDYFGTLLQFIGSNPSGHPLTVVINSIVNSLYMRYAYYAIAKEKGWWRTPLFAFVVALMTYGDDNIMTVKEGFDDYNHTAIAAQFAKVGIKYTMAEKEAESVPFIHLKEASFLKHFAVWDSELNLYRSPVEEASIAKMLHTHLRSGVLTMGQSSAEAIQNVALKYFEFGRDVYTERVAQLEHVARESGVHSLVGPIMSYDERLAWYREKFDL